jgi:Fe-S cluster biogenesis protein NfuA/nitrite reductase/ring-hydroxylating ferredoxin subunit
MLDEKAFQHRIQKIEGLIHKVETVADPEARALAVELIQALMDLHGAGLDRVMGIVSQAGEPGLDILNGFTRDDLVASLLLLYGLHPVDMETRVRQALDKVRPYLRSHGGNVDLLATAGGVVRLRLQGSCHGCPSSAMTLKLAIEEAICEAAPDVTAIEVEGVVEHPLDPGFVPVGSLQDKGATPQPAGGNGRWEEVAGLESLVHGAVRTVEVSGCSVLFCRLDETFYAYGSHCPRCGQALQAATLEANALVCPACGQRYDLVRAGRALDRPGLHLEPLPLLVGPGQAKVAVPHR